MLIDTHTHLYLDEFSADGGGAAAVDRALAAGIGHMVLPNVDLTTIEPMKSLHAVRPEATSMAIGFHPTEVDADFKEALVTIRHELEANRRDWVAIGEIGIDLYWDRTWRDQQMQAFEQQLLMASDSNLPVIIHCRDGLDETLEVLSGVPATRGVMHSFGGTADDVDRILSLNPSMYFGINGIVTFKNSHLREALPTIPADRLLLETDSPYLAPVPHRGRRCESAMLINTAVHIADYLKIPVDQLAATTTANASRLFGIVLANEGKTVGSAG